MVTTLVRDDVESTQTPTNTDPTLELDPSIRLFNTASGIQDSSITVIQNPIMTTNSGSLIGLLFSERFEQKPNREPDLVRVTHYLFEYDTGKLAATAQGYRKASIFTNRIGMLPYRFVAADGQYLPQASRRPYDIVFLDSNELDSLEGSLLKEIKTDLEMQVAERDGKISTKTQREFIRDVTGSKTASLYPTLSHVYRLLANRVSEYFLDPSGRLVVPRDYATFPITPELHAGYQRR